MYRLIRKLHLAVGLFVVPWALMYAISGFQMAHPDWLPVSHTTRQWESTLTAPSDDPKALARELREQSGSSGELRSVEVGDEQTSFRLRRPGTETDVEVDRATGKARIREQVADGLGFMSRMHHVAGWNRHVPTGLLGLFLVLVCLAMVFLGASGIYLWYKLVAERTTGWIVLGVGTAYALGLLVAIRLI